MNKKEKKETGEKEIFTLCVKLAEDGNGKSHFTLYATKNGKKIELRLYDLDFLVNAFMAMRNVTDFVARAYLKKKHDEGSLSDEEYKEMLGQ